jgi:hypothetical protein
MKRISPHSVHDELLDYHNITYIQKSNRRENDDLQRAKCDVTRARALKKQLNKFMWNNSLRYLHQRIKSFEISSCGLDF